MHAQHYSQLYRQLREVDPRDYQRIIRVYEEREAEIGRLDPVEHFELTAHYVDALFATGAYRQHQLMVDVAIQACIQHNIVEVEGIKGDVFQHMLLKKAASAYRLQQFDRASHVARELIRIDPHRRLTVRFLRASMFKEQRSTLQTGRAIFIFFLLFTAAVITVELLAVRTLYPAYLDYTQLAIGLSLAVAVGGLFGAYGYAYWRAHRGAHRFQRGAQNK